MALVSKMLSGDPAKLGPSLPVQSQLPEMPSEDLSEDGPVSQAPVSGGGGAPDPLANSMLPTGEGLDNTVPLEGLGQFMQNRGMDQGPSQAVKAMLGSRGGY